MFRYRSFIYLAFGKYWTYGTGLGTTDSVGGGEQVKWELEWSNSSDCWATHPNESWTALPPLTLLYK